MEVTALLSTFVQSKREYELTGKGEYAAQMLEDMGMMFREKRITPRASPQSFNVIIALRAMEYWKNCIPCRGDGFDRAFRCDALLTGFVLGKFYLRNYWEEFRHQIAQARSAIAYIEELIPEYHALAYIKMQPPMLFMAETEGIWRGYYARVERNPNTQPHEYPLIGETIMNPLLLEVDSDIQGEDREQLWLVSCGSYPDVVMDYLSEQDEDTWRLSPGLETTSNVYDKAKETLATVIQNCGFQLERNDDHWKISGNYHE